MALGLAEDDFWRRTPRQIARTFEAHGQRLRREHNDRMSLAWHIAAMPKMKKFPALKKLLVSVEGGQRHRVRQTPEQMLMIAKVMAGMSFPEIKPKV